MKLRHFSLLASISLFSFSTLSYAAAFQLYELGTPVIGTAGVGQAVTNDASIAYFNPAGMSLLPSSEIMLGSQLVLPFTEFSQNTQTTISGDNGGNAASLLPGIAMFTSYRYSPQLQFGVSLTAPYGGLLDYNDGWVGRYNVQNTQMFALNLNPAAAYRLNNWIAFGAGVSVEYAFLRQTVAIPLSLLPDGQVKVDADNFAPGFNLGTIMTPTQTTKVGIAYRSRIHHSLEGDVTFYRISAMPSVTTTLEMPQNVIVSVSQKVLEKFTLLGELGWANWSTMQNTEVNTSKLSGSVPRNWDDTYRVGLGGQYQYSPVLLMQAGVSYDSSPTDASTRLPDLPMDRQIRVGTGMIYKIIPAVSVGASYEYINFGDAEIYQTSSAGVLAGSYSKNYANVFQLSLNVNV